LAATETQEIVFKLLGRLPEQSQITLILFYWEDLTTREIAVILEEKEGTIRSRLSRDRRKLLRILDRSSKNLAQLRTGLVGVETVSMPESYARKRK